MDIEVDPHSPVPLYFQIAEGLRRRIEAGQLSPGDPLVPLREAAERLGVNLHTVRHAYTALARAGLVEASRASGTRVLALRRRRSSAKRRSTPRELERFLARVAHEAERAHGLSVVELAAALTRRAGMARRPVVHVIECNPRQCECHARELKTAWGVDARPWLLERAGELPAETLVATYFHYNDIRRRWPQRLRDIHFLTIGPAPELAAKIRARLAKSVRTRAVVCERDEHTAQNIAADVRALVPELARRIEARVGADIASSLDACSARRDLALCPPRVWGPLPARERRRNDVLEVRYTFDRAELERLGRELGWTGSAA